MKEKSPKLDFCEDLFPLTSMPSTSLPTTLPGPLREHVESNTIMDVKSMQDFHRDLPVDEVDL